MEKLTLDQIDDYNKLPIVVENAMSGKTFVLDFDEDHYTLKNEEVTVRFVPGDSLPNWYIKKLAGK